MCSGLWICMIFAAQAAVPGEGVTATMPDDRFFTSVVAQLMNPPASSREALEAARRNAPAIPRELAFEIESARSSAQAILQASFQPAASDPFVPFPKEAGRFDIIRCLYLADGMEMAVAESKYVISITISDPRFATQRADREKAEAIARKVMKMPDRIRLKQVGALGRGHYGVQDAEAAGRIDAAWPHWLDALRWWADGNTVGFVTLKASGGPTRAVISVEDQANRHWF